MYLIKTLPFGETTLLQISNSTTGEYFSCLPAFGAALNQLQLQGNDRINHRLLSENSSYDNLLSEGQAMYRGSKLFPFPNRIKKGKYTYNNTKYQLHINHQSEGHAIHGLVYNDAFKVIEQNTTPDCGFVVLEHIYNEKKGYPFHFKLQVRFELNENGFECTTSVKNTAKYSLPMGDGWHPYFSTGRRVDGLNLHIPKVAKMRIGERHFDKCYTLPEEKNKSVVELVDDEHNIHLKMWMQGQDYKYLQIYTPADRQSIALEPMTCKPNVLNHKKDLIVLSPNEEKKLSWGLQLK